jgi:hypothetical protein
MPGRAEPKSRRLGSAPAGQPTVREALPTKTKTLLRVPSPRADPAGGEHSVAREESGAARRARPVARDPHADTPVAFEALGRLQRSPPGAGSVVTQPRVPPPSQGMFNIQRAIPEQERSM